jgi:hypothetical protein
MKIIYPTFSLPANCSSGMAQNSDLKSMATKQAPGGHILFRHLPVRDSGCSMGANIEAFPISTVSGV